MNDAELLNWLKQEIGYQRQLLHQHQLVSKYSGFQATTGPVMERARLQLILSLDGEMLRVRSRMDDGRG